MAVQKRKDQSISGKTYSLYGADTDSDQYYDLIRELADSFLEKCPGEKELLLQVRKAGTKRLFAGKRSEKNALVPYIKRTLKEALSVYTVGVKEHLRKLPLSKRTDKTLKTREEQYHLYMLEIELVNRIYRDKFKNSEYKFALLPHCLRDFRPDCRAVPGDIESVCEGCTDDCFINLGSRLMKEFNIDPYISVTMDLEKLFKKLKAEHPNIGALGIACVPELANGMRLCIELGISPIGIPLDANRCSRWMEQCLESSFNIKELEELLTDTV
jgi:hypothetical protein